MALRQRRMMTLCAFEGKTKPCRRCLLCSYRTLDDVPDKILSIPLMTRILLENPEVPSLSQYHKDSAPFREFLVSLLQPSL